MAYDSNRGITTLFGGNSQMGIVGGTWQWNGATWTRQPSVTSPSARYGDSMAFDPAHNVTVMFGGYDGMSVLNDTWLWTVTTP
jgi:hypothetical protein